MSAGWEMHIQRSLTASVDQITQGAAIYHEYPDARIVERAYVEEWLCRCLQKPVDTGTLNKLAEWELRTLEMPVEALSS